MMIIQKTVKAFSILLLMLLSGSNLHCRNLNDSSDCAGDSKWIRLTEIKGEWVIYHYCFAGIGTMEISKQDDGTMKLIIFYGQDSDIYDVLDITRDNNRCYLRVKNHYSQSGETKDISFRYLDDSGRMTEWDLGGSTGKVHYILSGFENDVPALYENNGDCVEP